MSTSNRLHRVVPFTLWFAAGCATLIAGSSSKTAPFQGPEKLEARKKEIIAKADLAQSCVSFKKGEKVHGGIIEVTAQADGKLAARPVQWYGKPEHQTCILDLANKMTVTPLAGPPVSAFWPFVSPDDPTPPTPDPDKIPKGELQVVHARVGTAVDTCAQRYLPPEFPADIRITFFVLPGGKVADANVAESTAKDGDYEMCVLNAVSSAVFPDPHFEFPYPQAMGFHAGRLNKQL